MNDNVVDSLLLAAGGSSLRSIDLSWTSVTDASLRSIAEALAAVLERIKAVGCSLHGRKTITDTGVHALSRCSKLKVCLPLGGVCACVWIQAIRQGEHICILNQRWEFETFEF